LHHTFFVIDIKNILKNKFYFLFSSLYKLKTANNDEDEVRINIDNIIIFSFKKTPIIIEHNVATNTPNK